MRPSGFSVAFSVGKNELRSPETKFGCLRFQEDSLPIVNTDKTQQLINPRGSGHVGHASQRITPNPLVQYPLFEDQASDELQKDYNWVFGSSETLNISQRVVEKPNEIPTKDTITARIRGPDKKKRKPRTCKTCEPDCPQKKKCPGRYPRGKHSCSCTRECS